MGFISFIIATIFGCGAFGFSCSTQDSTAPIIHQQPSPTSQAAQTVQTARNPDTHSYSVTSVTSAGSPDTVITTTTDGKTTRQILPATSHGYKTSYRSVTVNGVTKTEATTTALTDADMEQMTAQQAAIQKRAEDTRANINTRIQEMLQKQNGFFERLRVDNQ